MSLNVFYTSTQDFPPHQLSPPRFDATCRLTYEKHETCAVQTQSLVKDTVKLLLIQF